MQGGPSHEAIKDFRAVETPLPGSQGYRIDS